jgi:hypothetical protein
MSLNIAAGNAVVASPNNTGSALCVSDAVEQVTISAAPGAGLNRIDQVILQPDGSDWNGSTATDFIFTTVQGNAVASGQVPPATPAGCVPLYNVAVGAQVTTIVAANLTDVRPRLFGPNSGAHCRLYRNAAWTAATGGGSWLQFDTAAEDPLTMLSTFGFPGEILLPCGGRWLITGSIASIPPAGNFTLTSAVQIRRSGNIITPNLSSSTSPITFVTGYGTPIGPVSYVAQQGDSIRINVAASGSTAFTGQTGPSVTYICCDYLGQ